ncbi:30S ribosomal protein S9 [Streptococcus sanguinis]|uniref:Small ribosomal subunit protein uS9 n=1 Tax=Streptococcus sanguinis TaxID=1305 RepID=A0A7Y0YRZ4_STRSA|nr:30S ribosomal protein S9 [Streptococcus sanguinis]
MSQAQYAGTGRRKNAVARVRLVPGTGKITVNKKDVEEYIPHADFAWLSTTIRSYSTVGQYDVFVNVDGVRSTLVNQALSVTVSLVPSSSRPRLPRSLNAGLLLCARMVERRNQVLRKARKASQFSKR